MLRIGEVAAMANVTADALRYYEREGLLAPASKSEGGYRLYTTDVLRRVHFIKHAQQCGFTLSEIRDLLLIRRDGAACCSDVRALAIEKRLQLEAKIKALRSMSDALQALVLTCVDGNEPVESCPILAALENAIVHPDPRSPSS